jgi:ATP-binding cassette subfamily C protein LapB
MKQLFASLLRLAQIQGQALDRLALQSSLESLAINSSKASSEPQAVIAGVLASLQLPKAQWRAGKSIDPSHAPGLLVDAQGQWGLLRGRNGQDQWVSEWFNEDENKWQENTASDLNAFEFAKLRLAKPFEASNSPVFRLIRDEVFQNRGTLFELMVGGILINVVALATSLYSMQVYDRVVPTGAMQTLLALTLGVLGAVVFELVVKLVRSHLSERLVDEVDSRLARSVFTRFLALRMDQMPNSVGALAGQLRGYETVRSFISTVPTQWLIDIPFVLLYVVVIGAIAGWLAAIPLGFMLVSLVMGVANLRRVEALGAKATQASNLKTGLLVEAIEGAETIKSGQGGWRMLSRWQQTTDDARGNELEMRHLSEHSQYYMAAMHQLSYALMVAMGALMVSRGEVTMGSLIACSILSGRILGPVATLPASLTSWGHCKAALQGLDRIWALQSDHHGVDHPISLESIRGDYEFEQVGYAYGASKALSIPKLIIRPGEKVGILGPVGAGKTTLLRLLSGMYRPQQGTVKLDGVDLTHLSKSVLAERVGYLQQDGRLFAGKLRDNLILGMIDPGDQAVLEAAQLTGLQQAVLARHPLGLHQPIHEGGSGLSGGQRQLANLTRVFLRKPRIWLLDEPTASMDRSLEVKVMQALAQQIGVNETLVLVTHKLEMLQLVDRVIVVADHRIVMDGPKGEVLARLQGAAQAPTPPNGPAAPLGAAA